MKIYAPWGKGALKEAWEGQKEGFQGMMDGLVGRAVSGHCTSEEIIATFNRVIDMNAESDLAIEAGKIIARLGR